MTTYIELQAGQEGWVLGFGDPDPRAVVTNPWRPDGRGAMVRLLEPAGSFKAGAIIAVRPSEFALDITRIGEGTEA